MAVTNDGFKLTLEEKDSPNYFFNHRFENNKQVGVSIDGQHQSKTPLLNCVLLTIIRLSLLKN